MWERRRRALDLHRRGPVEHLRYLKNYGYLENIRFYDPLMGGPVDLSVGQRMYLITANAEEPTTSQSACITSHDPDRIHL